MSSRSAPDISGLPYSYGSVRCAVCDVSSAHYWAPVDHHQRAEVLDSLYWPLIAGVLSGRLTAAALDDPASLTSIRALLVVRGGVEFWAGVAAIRAVASVWLPRLGGGLTRQHVESIVVGLVATAALVWSLARPHQDRLAPESPPAEPLGTGYDTASQFR